MEYRYVIEEHYWIIKFLENKYKETGNVKTLEKLIDRKRKLREHLKGEPVKYVCINRYTDNDNAIWKHFLPVEIKDRESAIDYFNTHLAMECRPSQYDCTGQLFTIDAVPAFQNGHWVIYHSVGMDI